MAQKALPTEKIEEMRTLRAQGLSVHEVAAQAGVSEGTVSNYTRDLPAPARGAQSNKKASKTQIGGKDTTGPVVSGPYDEDTKELANRVKKARLQAELDEVEDRKRQRTEIDDLRIRERKLMLQLDEARLGGKGDGTTATELIALRQDLAELREDRHRAELQQMESRHSMELRQVLAAQQTGIGRYDLISQGMGRLENMGAMVAGKVDSFVGSRRRDGDFMMGLKLGLTPEELATLRAGAPSILGKKEFMLSRSLARSMYSKNTGQPPFSKEQEAAAVQEDMAAYQQYLVDAQQSSQEYQALSQRVSQRLNSGGRGGVAATDKPGSSLKTGKAPVPGEQQPPVLTAESKLVTCSRCQVTFDVDLAAARQQSEPGKRLYVTCENPECRFMLDITELAGLKIEPKATERPAPECFVPGEDGHCDPPGHRQNLPGHLCKECSWK